MLGKAHATGLPLPSSHSSPSSDHGQSNGPPSASPPLFFFFMNVSRASHKRHAASHELGFCPSEVSLSQRARARRPTDPFSPPSPFSFRHNFGQKKRRHLPLAPPLLPPFFFPMFFFFLPFYFFPPFLATSEREASRSRCATVRRDGPSFLSLLLLGSLIFTNERKKGVCPRFLLLLFSSYPFSTPLLPSSRRCGVHVSCIPLFPFPLFPPPAPPSRPLPHSSRRMMFLERAGIDCFGASDPLSSSCTLL